MPRLQGLDNLEISTGEKAGGGDKLIKRLDLLLVVPNLPSSSWINALVTSTTQPLGIAYIASYLQRHEFKVKILDNSIEHLSDDEFLFFLKKNKPQVVGFTVSTSSYLQAVRLASLVKRYESKITVIMGGAHPSALPKETLSSNFVDIVIHGEGEETTLELMKELSSARRLSGVKGIGYKEHGKFYMNPQRDPIKDLDSLPMPAYALLPMGKYHHSPFRRVACGNVASIITSRGCAMNCSFCSKSVFAHGIRYRSIDSVIAEIKYLIGAFSVRELVLRDDAFTFDAQRAKDIAIGIKRLNANIKWSCYSCVNHASEKLYDIFYDSGCREICFGGESANDVVLKATGKKITAKQTERAIGLCKKYRISSLCSIIIGLPHDTVETVLETIRFLIKIEPDYAVFCVLVPMPGSSLFEQAVKNKLIDLKSTTWDDYVKVLSSKLPPITLCNISREDITMLQKKAFRSFYIRPGYFFKKLRRGPALIQLLQLVKGGYVFIRVQLHKFTHKTIKNK